MDALSTNDDSPAHGSGPADADAVKDFWLSCAKPAQARGTLEKLPTVKGTSKRGRDVARKQNHYLTRSFHSMPDGYDRIKWDHDLKGKTA
jgi:hypothetical protein